jgi:hypothetical protein
MAGGVEAGGVEAGGVGSRREVLRRAGLERAGIEPRTPINHQTIPADPPATSRRWRARQLTCAVRSRGDWGEERTRLGGGGLTVSRYYPLSRTLTSSRSRCPSPAPLSLQPALALFNCPHSLHLLSPPAPALSPATALVLAHLHPLTFTYFSTRCCSDFAPLSLFLARSRSLHPL